MLDSALIAYVVKYNQLREVQRAGIEADHFIDEWRNVWRYLISSKKQHGSIPSADALMARFPEVELPTVKRRDAPHLIHDIHQRRKYRTFLNTVDEVVGAISSYDHVDEAIQEMQASLNKLAFRGGNQASLVDLFSEDATTGMIEEIESRQDSVFGIPTGLDTFDKTCGGLQKQKMVVIMGRSGLGKSWLDILFVVKAVEAGKKVILYPLEMTLAETAFRLYTVFTAVNSNGRKVLKNYDLSSGQVTKRDAVKLIGKLTEMYEGKLLIADLSKLAGSYTNERIEAEVELHKPDMFWVDYLTLLKAPGGSRDIKGYEAVSMLSKGIKGIAMRNSCVGGCSAQVNREGIFKEQFLPRLEHIAYGDSIGQDADLVFSINRKDDKLMYALVKNRGGPEIGPTAVKFNVNIGEIRETGETE